MVYALSCTLYMSFHYMHLHNSKSMKLAVNNLGYNMVYMPQVNLDRPVTLLPALYTILTGAVQSHGLYTITMVLIMVGKSSHILNT
jgi:hypothetical protein